MTNILKKLGIGNADFGKWFAGAAQETANLEAKIEKSSAPPSPWKHPSSQVWPAW